jgi:stress response protein SCP2
MGIHGNATCVLNFDDAEGILIGEMERVGSEWFFNAIGKTVKGGLGKIADDYGMIISENMK